MSERARTPSTIEVHFTIVDTRTLVAGAEAERAAIEAGIEPGDHAGAIDLLEQHRRENRELEERLVFRIPAGSGTPQPAGDAY